MTHGENELTAMALAETWKQGDREGVLRFLDQQRPIVAAFLAMAVLGMLTRDAGPTAGREWIDAIDARASETSGAIG